MQIILVFCCADGIKARVRKIDYKYLVPLLSEWITEQLVGSEGAFSHDWKARVEAPVSQNVHVNRGGTLPRPKPVFEVSNVEAREVINKDKWKVTTANADHVKPRLKSLAYRVDSNYGSIVFAGDTAPCESIAELARKADVLVVNCWDHQETMDENGESPGQTGTLDVAKMACDTNVKKLILTHIGSELSKPGSREKAIQDIGSIYQGEIIFGEELMKLEVL